MKGKKLALGAITALALSAHAQTYNWTLTTDGTGNPGNGSGTLTLTSGGIVTAMSGSVGGGNVTLLAPDTFLNDNELPLTSDGISFNIAGFGDINVWGPSPACDWANRALDAGSATFTYTPVPEPATWATGGVFGLGALLTVAARRRRQAAQPG